MIVEIVIASVVGVITLGIIAPIVLITVKVVSSRPPLACIPRLVWEDYVELVL